MADATFNNPAAYMGFVGFVRIDNKMIVRATSADINLRQTIDKPDVIDSRYDKTVYQLGPKEVEGSLAFPAVYDIQEGGENVVRFLYQKAIERNTENGLLATFPIDVKYAANQAPNSSNFSYVNCLVDTFGFSVAQQASVDITVGVIGQDRIEISELDTPSLEQVDNTRLVTWNNAVVSLATRNNVTIGGEFIRTFNVNINNNSVRFYTLNGLLSPQAIAPTKRDITGSAVLMGRHVDLGIAARNNPFYCTAEGQVVFGFNTNTSTDTLASGCDATFGVTIPNVVYEIEEMALVTDLFETTVNWHALPAAGTGIDDPLLTSFLDS